MGSVTSGAEGWAIPPAPERVRDPAIIVGAEWVKRGKLIDTGTWKQRAAWALAGEELCCRIIRSNDREVWWIYWDDRGPRSEVHMDTPEAFRMQWEPLP